MWRLLKLLWSLTKVWNLTRHFLWTWVFLFCQKYGKSLHTEPIASLPITQSSLLWQFSSCSSALNWCLGEKAQKSKFSNFYWLRRVESSLKEGNFSAKSDSSKNNPKLKGDFFCVLFSSVFIRFPLIGNSCFSEWEQHFVQFGNEEKLLRIFVFKIAEWFQIHGGCD